MLDDRVRALQVQEPQPPELGNGCQHLADPRGRRLELATIDRQLLEIRAAAVRHPLLAPRAELERQAPEQRHRGRDPGVAQPELGHRRELREPVDGDRRVAHLGVTHDDGLEERQLGVDEHVDGLLEPDQLSDRDAPHEPATRMPEQLRERRNAVALIVERLDADLVDEAAAPSDPRRRQ